jgi:hypothetical protein
MTPFVKKSLKTAIYRTIKVGMFYIFVLYFKVVGRSTLMISCWAEGESTFCDERRIVTTGDLQVMFFGTGDSIEMWLVNSKGKIRHIPSPAVHSVGGYP